MQTKAPTVAPPISIQVQYYIGSNRWRSLPDFSSLNPYKTDYVETIYHTNSKEAFMTSGRWSNVGAVFTADLEFPSGGQ